jgi:hypothetical protein
MARSTTEEFSAAEHYPHHLDGAEPGLAPPARRTWCPAASDQLVAILFVIFLFLPPTAYLLGWRGSATLNENRRLAPAPSESDSIEAWPAKLEAYYNDRFGFRADLVRLNGLLLHKYLGASNADVLIGRDGWMFFAQQDIFKDFFGKAHFSEAELQRWKEYLEGRQVALARTNAHYLFVIAPDKNTIYPEYLPSYIRDHRGQSRLEQLTEYLRRENSPAQILDLHTALLQGKGQGLLYFPQDTHWNGRGFFVGYRSICDYLSRWIPNIHAMQMGTDYKLEAVHWPGGDWGMLGLPDQNLPYKSEFLVTLGTQRARKGVAPFPDELARTPDPLKIPLYLDGPGRESLLIFHDSFMRIGTMNMEQVPLAEHFARTLLVGMQPSEREFQLITDKFHPDIVIEERAERFMSNVPPR